MLLYVRHDEHLPDHWIVQRLFWERARRFGQSHEGDDGYDEWRRNDARWQILFVTVITLLCELLRVY